MYIYIYCVYEEHAYIYIHPYIYICACKCKLYLYTVYIYIYYIVKHRLFHPPQMYDPRLARQAEGFCTKFCTANSDEHSAPVAAGGRCLGDSNAPVLQDTFNQKSLECYTLSPSHMMAIHTEVAFSALSSLDRQPQGAYAPAEWRLKTFKPGIQTDRDWQELPPTSNGFESWISWMRRISHLSGA